MPFLPGSSDANRLVSDQLRGDPDAESEGAEHRVYRRCGATVADLPVAVMGWLCRN
jgi:hypothetical protein